MNGVVIGEVNGVVIVTDEVGSRCESELQCSVEVLLGVLKFGGSSVRLPDGCLE